MDGIDAALVDFRNDSLRLQDYLQEPLAPALRDELLAVNKDSAITDISILDVQMGRLFAEVSLELMERNAIHRREIQGIGCHGQTLLHRPEMPYPTSLQIGDGNIIAHNTGVTTVTDFRRMDLAAGGQGAPLAPVFHAQVFRDKSLDRVVLNLGGMANITLLPQTKSADPLTGFDTGPANVFLDTWIFEQKGLAYDKEGLWAKSGNVDEKLLDCFLDDPYFELTPPKSTGRDHFNSSWLRQKLGESGLSLPPEDVQATLVELTVVTIAKAIKSSGFDPGEMIVCGGGAHNQYLIERLNAHLEQIHIDTSEAFGIIPDAVEAVAFAWLAKRRLEKKPGNLPALTGAESEQILGAVYQPCSGDTDN